MPPLDPPKRMLLTTLHPQPHELLDDDGVFCDGDLDSGAVAG